MSPNKIPWKLPWRPLQFEAEIPGVQKQLEKEITSKHRLWGKNPTVIGRRVDCDDVLVKLNDGSFANVHLVWGSDPSAFPEEYPSTIVYDSLQEFIAEMERDAVEYGNET